MEVTEVLSGVPGTCSAEASSEAGGFALNAIRDTIFFDVEADFGLWFRHRRGHELADSLRAGSAGPRVRNLRCQFGI